MNDAIEKAREAAVNRIAKNAPAWGGNPLSCWVWEGRCRNKRGYASMHYRGRQRPATQVAWELEHKATFPVGMFACHSCDNPSCVNPHHIWPGSNRDNVDDAVKKGRMSGAPQKAHCVNGHPLTDETTRKLRKGGRECLPCKRARLREYKRRRRGREAIYAAMIAAEGK